MSNIGPKIGIATPSYAGVSGGGGAAPSVWTLISQTQAVSGTASPLTTPAINTTGADLFIMAAATTGAQTPSDSAANAGWATAWTLGTSGNTRVSIYYCPHPTTNAAQTFTVTTGAFSTAMAVLAYSGSRTTPLDQATGIAIASLWTTSQPGSITPTANNELIVAAVSIGSLATTLTMAGFTVEDFQDWLNGTQFAGLGLATFVQPTAAAIDPTWTRGTAATGSDTGGNAIASFFHA